MSVGHNKTTTRDKMILLVFLSIITFVFGFGNNEEYSYPFDFEDNEEQSTCYTPIDDSYCTSKHPITVRRSLSPKGVHCESTGKGGCFTLSELWKEPNQDFLFAIDPVTNTVSKIPTGTWFLTQDLYITDGITLNMFGLDRGGDCDELRLSSDPSGFINLRGHGGSLNLKNTKVVSWDTTKTIPGPDTNIKDGRSYVSCISEKVIDATLQCEGMAMNTMGECTMDISCSEISHLGYNQSESWGLSYEVRGFCSDKRNPDIFDEVGVYGNISDSDIHDNFHGHSSYGHQDGNWIGNVFHGNTENGMNHYYSRNLKIHDNIVRRNGNHGIFASKLRTDLSIRNNEVYKNKDGIFLHVCDSSVVMDNHVHDNFVTGMSLNESSRGTISGNVIEDNNVGLKVSVGSENVFKGNEFIGSISYDVFNTGSPSGNIFYKNIFYVSRDSRNVKRNPGYYGLHIQDTDNMKFTNNMFKNGVGYFSAKNSKQMLFVNNDQFILNVDEESCTNAASDTDVTSKVKIC